MFVMKTNLSNIKDNGLSDCFSRISIPDKVYRNSKGNGISLMIILGHDDIRNYVIINHRKFFCCCRLLDNTSAFRRKKTIDFFLDYETMINRSHFHFEFLFNGFRHFCFCTFPSGKRTRNVNICINYILTSTT